MPPTPDPRIPPPERSSQWGLLTPCLMLIATWLLPSVHAQQSPAITYAVSLGARGMASDPAGNVYVVGGGISSTTPGVAYPTPPQGYADYFPLIKLDPQGALVFATYLPGIPFGVAVDQSGNAYVGAYTGDTPLGQKMGFLVAMVDPTGATATLTRTYGGTCDGSYACDIMTSFAIDGQGNSYLAGYTSAPDVSTTPGAFQPKLSCHPTYCLPNGFLIKVNPKSGQVVYATYLGGSGGIGSGDYIHGVTGDVSGNLYAVGFTTSPDFPVTPGAYRATFPGSSSGFITKLNPAGAAVYSTFFAGGLGGVAADASGAAYVTGSDGTGTALTPDAVGNGTVVAKLSPDGKSLIFASLFDHGSYGRAIAVDATGSPIVVGTTQDTLLPELTPLQGQRGNTNPPTICDPGSNAQFECHDAFLVKLDPQGKYLLWASTLGAKGDDTGEAVAVDAAGNVYAWITGFNGFTVPGVNPGGSTIIKVEPGAGPPPLFGGNSVVSSAGFTPGIAAGSLVSIFGTGLSTADGIVTAPGFPLPATLAGTSLWFGAGEFDHGRRPAAILATANINGQEQLNAQVPVLDLSNAADQNVDFSQVIMRKGRALGFGFDVKTLGSSGYWPSIFLTTDGQPIVTHADYSLVTSSSPAHAGETIIIFATGLGQVTPAIATGVAAPLSPLTATVLASPITIGGQKATVTFSGLAPGFAGLYQVNVVVPAVSPGQLSLILGVGTSVPTTVTIAVQ